jgi:phosphoenolpyruvate-protein phosphotransferase (PTS system enzyme I)
MIAQSLKGIGASAGIAIAKAYRLEEPKLVVEKRVIDSIEAEVQRFDAAIKQSTSELEQIKEHAFKKLGEDKAAIFAAHLYSFGEVLVTATP